MNMLILQFDTSLLRFYVQIHQNKNSLIAKPFSVNLKSEKYMTGNFNFYFLTIYDTII